MLNTNALCLSWYLPSKQPTPSERLQMVSVFAFQATVGRCPPDRTACLWGAEPLRWQGTFCGVLTFPLWVQEPHPVLLN